MTDKERKIIERINKYAEKEKIETKSVSGQGYLPVDKIRPILSTISKEENMSLEDIFILYMDLASEYALEQKNKTEKDYIDISKELDKIVKDMK